MTKRRVFLLSAWLCLAACGCAEMAGSLVETATESIFGDNYGPVFTGEKRGEYRDRKEAERLGGADEFREKHGRDPDLYWPERFKNE